MRSSFRLVGAVLGAGAMTAAISQAGSRPETGNPVIALRPLKATATRVGNSIGGLDPRKGAVFPGGAPIRAKVPMTAEQVGIETDRTGTKKLLRVRSGWNEGGYHTVWFDLKGNYLGGAFDFPWTAGAWIVGLLPDSTDADRKPARIKDIPPNDAKKVPGYSWRQDKSGLTIKTPGFTHYTAVTTDNVVSDPDDQKTLWSPLNRFAVDWERRGGGREVLGHTSTVDARRFPTDPRLHSPHQTPYRVFRIGGEKYLASGGEMVNLHRWDAERAVFVPSASFHVRPDFARAAHPGAPELKWGDGMVWRDRDGDGLSEAGEYEKFGSPGLWNVLDWQVDPSGNFWWMPFWGHPKDAQAAHYLPVGSAPDGRKNPVYDPGRRVTRRLPAALMTADECGASRIHWLTGDLAAIVRRGKVWRLELYPGWAKSGTPERVAAKWSTPNVATRMRRGVEPHETFRADMCGTIAAEGDYVFLVEGIGCGVRVYRRSDGRPVGRMFDRNFANSTVDEPRGGFHVWRQGDEYVCSVMDFNGSAAALWRVGEAELRR